MKGTTLHPGAADYSFSDVIRLQKRFQQPSFTLEPGAFVLAWTEEEITLPEKSRVAARVEGKSSLARLGVGIHVIRLPRDCFAARKPASLRSRAVIRHPAYSAGCRITARVIHSGFSGNIQLEVFNLGPHKTVLDAGMRVCQLVFERTHGTPTKGYDGLFAGQKAALTS